MNQSTLPNTKRSWLSTEIESVVRRAEDEYRRIGKEVPAIELSLKDNEDRLAGLLETQELVRKLAQDCQIQCQARISSVVTRCIESVLGEPKYTFEMVFETKRNQTEVSLVLKDEAGNLYDPVTDLGGGILDIVSFGLRLACLLLTKPKPRKILIMDESFKFVSRQYQPAVARLLESLCSEFGMQIILVTHISELMKGNVIEL